MLVGRFLLATIGLLLLSAESGAQEVRSLDWYRSVTIDVLTNARRMIRPVLPSDERRVERSIKFRVTTDPGFIAQANYADGDPQVVISAGAIQAIEFIADAIVFDELGSSGCAKEYAQYWSNMTIENTERYNQGLSPRPVPSPAIYAESGSTDCSVDLDEFAADQEMQTIKARMIEASIVYLYLHELGHHVKGHLESNASSTGFIRRQEDEADRYAIETALRANYSLLAAAPLMMIIAGTGGNSLEAELKSTHPLGLRRYLTLIEGMVDHYSKEPGEDSLVADLETFAADLRRQIESLQ